MEKLLALLDSIRPLSAALTVHLESMIRSRTLEKKAFLLKAGHVCRNIAFIESGLLRCYYFEHETDLSAWFMKEGDVVVSVESFFSQRPGSQYIQALEQTRLWYISWQELQQTYREFPEFNITGRIITENYYVQSEQRSRIMRSQRAHERYRYLLENHSELVRRVPSKYLASYLGISEVTLSTIKSKKLAW